jgi:hypothetical protein
MAARPSALARLAAAHAHTRGVFAIDYSTSQVVVDEKAKRLFVTTRVASDCTSLSTIAVDKDVQIQENR